MCHEIQARLTSLRAQKRQIEALMGTLPSKVDNLQNGLDAVNAQIAIEERALADCLAIAQQQANPTPRAFRANVTEIYCDEANAELGDAEPYLLIASFDMRATLPLPVPVARPAVHVFRIGPWSGIHEGSLFRPGAATPAFWDLDSRPRIVAAPQDVLFLVAVVENDGSSPDAIRGTVHAALEASILLNQNRAYPTFADTMASNMAGTIDTASLEGLDPAHLNADDRIGGVRQLLLTLLCKAVEVTGVVREHLVDNGAGHILPRPHIAKNLRLP